MPRRRSKSIIPEIPLETWRSLYRSADELRTLALWECMGDAELLGLDDPRTGEPMLGVIMGMMGQVFGLALHYGPGALRYVLEAALGYMDEADMEEFRQISALKVEFVPKRELTSPEKQRVKDLDFRPTPGGPRMWPSFQSMRPGRVPWDIDLAEAELLLYALPRLTALGSRVRPLYEEGNCSPHDGFAFWPRGRAPAAKPLRSREIEWRRLSVPPSPAPEAFLVNETIENALRSIPKARNQIFELDAFSGFGIIDEGERPWFAKMGVAGEVESGLILAAEMGSGPDEALETIAGRTLIRALQMIKTCPAAIRVQRVRIEHALTPLADRLGFRLELRRELPALDQFKAGITERFG